MTALDPKAHRAAAEALVAEAGYQPDCPGYATCVKGAMAEIKVALEAYFAALPTLKRCAPKPVGYNRLGLRPADTEPKHIRDTV